MPRVTARNAFNGKQESLQCTVLVNCLYGVLRTAWRITTTTAHAEQRAQEILVSSNWDNQEFSHCLITLVQCFSRFEINCALSIDIIDRRTMITMSLAGKRCWFFRKLSRKILFKRFRSTAFCICFLAIANPSLGQTPAWLPTSIVMLASSTRLLLLKICRNCAARTSLNCLGNDSLPRTPIIKKTSLGRQACPALGSTRLDNPATASSLHTSAKSMRSGSFQVARLECTFHVSVLCFCSPTKPIRRDNVLV